MQTTALKSGSSVSARSTTGLWWLRTGTFWFALICIALLIFGWNFPTGRYLTPQRGVGYVLGIVGGSLMLLLLLYPARKRWRWLSFMGSVKGWFQTHMVLGIIGPLCILFHANFRTGAVNSNVALYCMLIVSGSGLVGRYFYTRIHHGLTERATSLAELQARADRLKSGAVSLPFLPELLDRLTLVERQLLQRVAACPMVLRPLYAWSLAALACWQLQSYVREALKQAAHSSSTLAAQRQRLTRTARNYVSERLRATRELSEFQAYTRLFSLWHVLHLPLFFMLLLAGIVHVIAVHVY